jgi:hypothetical protein
MKIIKKGRAQKGWSKEFKCTGGCGATLLVEESDLYHDGSTETYTTFTCACCGVATDVYVPSSVNVRKSRLARPVQCSAKQSGMAKE